MTKDLTPRQEAYAKLLRRQIMAVVANNGWKKDEFYDYLEAWDYGRSLRALSISQLLAVKKMCETSKGHADAPGKQIKRSDESKYNAQGMYIHSLMKQAGWTTDRMRNYLIQHFKKSHINVLSAKQRRALILMFEKYVERRKDDTQRNAQ